MDLTPAVPNHDTVGGTSCIPGALPDNTAPEKHDEKP